MESAVEERLESAAKAVRDDIRGAFKNLPQYRDYLADLLVEAANEINDLRQQIPAPPPQD